MRWFINRKTSFKLLSSFIFISIILAGVSVYAMTSMKKFDRIVWGFYEEALKPMENMSDARNELQQLRTGWFEIVTSDSQTDRAENWEKVKALREDVEKNITIYTDSYKGYGEAIEQEAQLFFDQFMADFNAYNQLFDDTIQSASADRSKIQQLDAEIIEHHDRLINHINEIWEVDMSLSEEEFHDSEKLYSTTSITMIVITILTLAICITLGSFLTKVIARPLDEMANLMEKVAEGDLTQSSDINTKDEIGLLAQSVNHMIVNLRNTTQNILSAAANLSASSEQVSASTDEIAGASANQAASAQTMNELFRELSEAIDAIAQNTEQAAELANRTIQIAQDGEKVVLSSVEGANQVSEQMERLEQDSSRIGEIIEVIDDISDQTNLLALNAAIEAARAGEQGRGFAVVADEVRKLAERSGEATKQITAIIKGMQKNTTLSVKSVHEGLSYTQQSGEAFEHIINMVNDTGNKVTEIAGASEEQAAQSAEVLTFIESISAATEEASASSEETASTARALTELAEELNTSVAAFKLS